MRYHVAVPLPTRQLPESPNIEQMEREARELQPAASDENAKRALAESYGFESWLKLKAYIEGATIRSLAAALREDDLTAVQKMLQARPELADMTMSYGDEHRPIHFAVMKRSPEMVRLLMRSGANAREGIHPHRDATTAWTLAKERGFNELVEIIEEEERQRGPVVEASREPEVYGDEAARAAVASGDVEWLRARQAEGALVNLVRWDDGGLLTVAVRHNRLEILRMLLDHGFDPDERVSLGEGDWAAYSQGYPLWSAAALGRREMAELLLERGANPNVHVDSSGSAVYSAYSHRQWEMVELLRRHGGIVTADTAAIYRQTDLARQILAEGVVESNKANVEELLRFAASGGDPEIVQMALEQVKWPRSDPRWFRILTEPLSFWHHIPWLYAGNPDLDRGTYLQCFRLILDRCDPNLIGGFGRTALHEVAAMGDHVTDEEVTAFASALLNAGARMDLRDDILQSTPLGWACRWGRAHLVDLLITRGADITEADAEPWATPTAWAQTMGHDEVLAALRR